MVSLIPISTEDGVALEQIHATCFPDAWDLETFDQLLMEEMTCGWLATSNEGYPVGFILARVLGDEAEILTFAVRPQYQRGGIGRLLLSELMDFLISVDCVKIFLEVAVDNPGAIALYKSMDYIIVGKRPNYYKRDNQTFVCASVMVWTKADIE